MTPHDHSTTEVTSRTPAHATALVLSPEVEGAQLMAPHYLRCFQDHAYTAAQIPIAEFHDYDTARAWLSSTLIALP